MVLAQSDGWWKINVMTTSVCKTMSGHLSTALMALGRAADGVKQQHGRCNDASRVQTLTVVQGAFCQVEHCPHCRHSGHGTKRRRRRSRLGRSWPRWDVGA